MISLKKMSGSAVNNPAMVNRNQYLARMGVASNLENLNGVLGGAPNKHFCKIPTVRKFGKSVTGYPVALLAKNVNQGA